MGLLNKKPNFIDLFSGAGGLSCGLEMAGWNCLLGADHDKDSIETFSYNHKNATTFLGDISKLTRTKIDKLTGNKKIHAIVGGPPCQGFSTVGKGDTKDKRNKLFKHFVRLVKELEPKVVIFENVTGILAKKNQAIYCDIINSFRDIGYEMDVKVYSSEEYGVPQIRKRPIFIAVRNKETEIKVRKSTKKRTVGDAFKEIPKDAPNNSLESAYIRNGKTRAMLSYIPEGCGVRYEADEKKYLPKHRRFGVNWDELSEGRFRQTKLQRLHRKKQSFTILTGRSIYYHPTQDRYLTVREAAAIQSFPNDFKFFGSTTSQWKQIGNAVPPLMAKAIGTAIRRQIF